MGSMKAQELLRRAYRRTPEILIDEVDGRIEVVWFRRHTDTLRSTCRVVADTLSEALLELIRQEDEAIVRRDHGDACPCDDCCIYRVDRERA